MAASSETFVNDLNTFFLDSISWCEKTSEAETGAILSTLQSILEDLKRRSKMSEQAESAFMEAESKINSLATDKSRVAVGEILGELKSLRSDNTEMNTLVNPVVEALQFQDQFSQNLHGIRTLIATWFENFEKRDADSLSKEEQDAFVEQLLSKVTSSVERSVICRHFEYKG